ncbi:MAG: OprD family porin, partial [Gammaproteobacteria bacterium]|nr:OprD family porin [Gammaproteobacteria bacterium]
MQDHRKTTHSLLCLGVALGTAGTANAAFLDDSKATVELRNFYMNRDFRQSGAPQSKADEWAQGFILKMES